MIEKIQVQEVIKGRTGINAKGAWTQVTVVAADGRRFSAFDAKLLSLKSGAVIEIDWEKKGDFNNLSSWHIITEAPANAPEATKVAEINRQNESDQRRRSMSLSYAKDLAMAPAPVIKVTEILTWATTFDRWLETGK